LEYLVFTPTWNESLNIELLIREIMTLDPRIHLLIVDDKSPDGTGEIAESLCTEFPRLHVLHREGPRGRGWAGIAGYIWALDNNAKFLIEMDADFSHQPKYIPHFMEALQTADMVIGSRYVKGGRDLRPGWLRRTVSWFANSYQRIVFSTSIKDCTSGYRAYRTSLLEKIGVRQISTWGPAILSDVLFRVVNNPFRVVEIPIEFPDRERGESTLTTKILWEGIANVVRLRFRGIP
jgi:dolichol-phosphate mannosyltransferase